MTDIEILALDTFTRKATKVISQNGHFDCISCEGKSADIGSFIRFVFDSSSVYRDNEVRTENIAYIHKTGKSLYIAFNEAYAKYFNEYNIVYPKILSDHRIRFDLTSFEKLCEDEAFPIIVEKILFTSLNYQKFGCCGKYVACSDAKKCLHDDIFYATASCEYKKHLDNGEIFYGKNKNI